MSHISEPESAEEVRRQIEDRFRRLVEVMPVAVYVCDTTGIIQSYNKRAVELWGREPRDQGTRRSVIAAHCVAARAARASGRAGWRKPRHPCGRQGDRRDEPRSVRSDRGGNVSIGSVLPAERVSDRGAAAAKTARGYSDPGRVLRQAVRGKDG